MFEKIKIKAQIRRCKKRIEELEHKRTRSQAALMDTILSKKQPNDEDVDYFNKYTAQINTERAYLQRLYDKLEKNKKTGKINEKKE